jgi:hypothetical protein
VPGFVSAMAAFPDSVISDRRNPRESSWLYLEYDYNFPCYN